MLTITNSTIASRVSTHLCVNAHHPFLMILWVTCTCIIMYKWPLRVSAHPRFLTHEFKSPLVLAWDTAVTPCVGIEAYSSSSMCGWCGSFSALSPHVQLVRLTDDVLVDHVACGSAHSVAWSSVRRKVVCRLPEKVPMEFNHLQAIPMPVLRNRLILLHHFSNMFCKSLNLFGLQSWHLDGIHESAFQGFDRLRAIILSNAKVVQTIITPSTDLVMTCPFSLPSSRSRRSEG